jgi:D-alanine transaminase
MYQEALDEDASECFFIRNGVFTEASHSNIMAIRNGTLYTHPDSGYILPGITKKVVFGLCKDLHIAVREEPVKASAVPAYDEFFITGTGNEIMPVVQIDDHVIRNGKPGVYTRMLQRAFFRITYETLAGVQIRI